jgi:molecular chaperone HscB
MNYFEWFDLPVAFAIDNAVLKRKYFELSKKYHPDFFTNANAIEKEKVLELSTLNTNAFNTLNDFDKRMKYILLLKNVIADDEKFDLPPSFLMEMMDLNEQISEGIALENCKHEIKKNEASLYNDVNTILQTNDLNNASIADLEQVKIFYFKKKYLSRLKKKLE